MNLTARLPHPDLDRPALSWSGGSLSHRQLAGEVARWRAALRRAGVADGDRVAVIAGNEPRFVLAHLATLGLGALSVPLNPEAPPAELRRQLDEVTPRLVVVGTVGPADDVDLGAPRLDPTALDGPDGSDGSDARPDSTDVVDVGADHPAVLLFTSGTAGTPRPVVLTHGNLTASLDALRAHSSELTAIPQAILAVIPLFHVFGLNAVLHLGLDLGAEVVLTDRTDPSSLARLVADRAVTVIGGPPQLWQHLVDAPDVADDAFSTVILAVSGAAKLAPSTAVAVRERFGLELVEGYGLTETAAAVASGVGAGAPVGSVGRLLPGVSARIVDASGDDVLVGDPGELLVAGPMVSPGFYRVGDGTVEASSADGWLRTGDVAVVDDAGNLAIVDRIKDVVLVSGFNVYPGEVEAVLRGHPSVAEAGVVGRPDPTTGERVVAYVVPVAGATPGADELIDHCRHHLARYKVPSEVVVRAELPTGVAGKLRRRDLT